MIVSQHAHAKTPHLWSLEEYYRLAELNVFGERRVELIGGVIYDMTPQGWKHSTSIMEANNLLVMAYGRTHYVRVQLPLNIRDDSAPEPDFAILPKSMLAPAQPTTADLVIEVSESSLPFDIRKKQSLYASAEILEYWVVNIEKDRLEVFRHPESDDSADFGASYRTKTTKERDEQVSALFCPEVSLSVAELLGTR